MKKLLLFVFLILFLCGNANAESRDRDVELNQLFYQLKKSKNASIAIEIERRIWSIWSTHPTEEKLTSSLAIGSNLMSNGELEIAHEIFSKIIRGNLFISLANLVFFHF